MERRQTEIRDAAATPWSAASFCMEGGKRTVLFEDQTGEDEESGRSLLMTAPEVWLVEREGRFVEEPTNEIVDDPIAWMRSHHRPMKAENSGLFMGGVAGFLGFEFGWRLDSPVVECRESRVSDLWVGAFEAGAVYDHSKDNWSVVGRTESAVEELVEAIRAAPGQPKSGSGVGRRLTDRDVGAGDYADRVQAAVDAIYAGELFEVNYTERFFGRWSGDRRALYAGLRDKAPGDFGGLVDGDGISVMSISPEQFLAVEADGRVVTRPIKGTRPRGETPDEDRRLATELVSSEKDRAENVMIVDLMRNDLTRVCRPGSVEATELCELHSFESVHHLISTVEGRLAEEFDALDAFVASFPAGSITGAPKLRSMEWIASSEETPRGPYTGSMFYWSDHGRLDSNVLIRTAVLDEEGVVEYGAGGAVVSDSEPDGEYEEALWKARPFFEVLEDE